MIVLEKQRKALTYRKDYELGQTKLKMQIVHYQEIYKEQQELKSMRHDICDKYIAISGLLNSGQTQEAIEQINKMHEHVIKESDIVNTGFPAIDAVLSVKKAKANESGIDLMISVMLEGDLYIDQFDLAVILANALDNAIEGIQRSVDIEKTIKLSMSRVTDYISIIVENFASGPIYGGFKTSKPDVKNHGFGMTQMMEMTKKYNGSFRPLYNDEVKKFSLKIMLRNKE
jgi:sensor histidine kinase regulating citrate/malate metabolism